MHRTQIYLDPEMQRALAAEAARRGTTVSEVIRARLGRTLEAEPVMDPVAAVAQAVGLWSDRSDLPDTATYVRQLRRDTRPLRHGTARAPHSRRY